MGHPPHPTPPPTFWGPECAYMVQIDALSTPEVRVQVSSQSYAASQSDGAFVQHQFQKELRAQSKSVNWTSQSSYLHHDLKGVRSSSLRGSLPPVREARLLFHSLGWVTAQLLWKFQVSSFLCSSLRSRRKSWLSAAHSAPGAQVVSVSRGLGRPGHCAQKLAGIEQQEHREPDLTHWRRSPGTGVISNGCWLSSVCYIWSSAAPITNES